MTLRKKTFLLFITAFSIQMALIVVFMILGFRHSEDQWRTVRYQQAYQKALQVLTPQATLSDISEFTGQIAIYAVDGTLIATNRGSGESAGKGGSRALQAAERFPVYDKEQLVGYYSIGSMDFRQDSANQALLDSMGIVGVVSLMVSFGISLLVAMYFSRTVSHPADYLDARLHAMATGDLSQPIEGEGAEEMVRIAQSSETLRTRLLAERTVRTQWAQDLAHDLRTPVASIKAQLEGMADGVLSPSPGRFEKTIHELERMEGLIHDLEELMRLESPEMSIARHPVDALRFLQASKDRFEAVAAKNGIRFESSTSLETFFADELLLFRAVSNVLSNAVRHAGVGGLVSMDISGDNGTACIKVHNTGDFIPAHELPRVFDRLYRGEFARNTPGSGLGLTIAQRIAVLHGGSISIESSQDTGTLVTFTLPGS